MKHLKLFSIYIGAIILGQIMEGVMMGLGYDTSYAEIIANAVMFFLITKEIKYFK